MKTIQIRENARKLKQNTYPSKDAQSQSPPHKKLIKKIEMLHKDTSHKTDMSLKEDLLAREPQEEVVVDFRVEIERRFMKASANHTYQFPRKASVESESAEENGGGSTLNESFESLKHVTVYDLSSQNNKRKATQQKQPVFRSALSEDRQISKSTSNYGHREVDVENDNELAGWEEEERSGVPIELRLRDKSTSTYRTLLQLVEQQLNPSDDVQKQNILARFQMVKKQQTRQEQPASKPVPTTIQNNQFAVRDNNNVKDAVGSNMQTVEDEEDVSTYKLDQSKIKKERNIKSQERSDRPERGTTYNLVDLQRQEKAINNSEVQRGKKTFSQDRTGGSRVETSAGSSAIEKTMSHLNVSTAKGDNSKIPQESFKKMYNSTVLKSITPQYNNNSQMINLKENAFKIYSQESYQSANTKSTIDNLYQKAKNEVLNRGVKSSAINPARYQIKNANNSMSVTKREETPKDVVRKVNFNNFYGSPEVTVDKSSRVVSQSNLPKKESIKVFQIASPYKKTNESQMQSSYEYTSQSKIIKRPNYMFDMNKREQAYRESLSSTRNRNKRTPDRVSDILGNDSAMRNSYDTQQYNSVLNSSSQKYTSKKTIGFTPTGSTAKNLSFTKTFFSYK